MRTSGIEKKLFVFAITTSKQEIKANKKWEYFARDCHFI
jgi:hypothetical protein